MKSYGRILVLAVAVACLVAPAAAMADTQFFSTRTIRVSPTHTYSEPAISGSWVVYCDDNILGPAKNVWVTNLGTGVSRALHAQNKTQSSPDISGTKVVWDDRRNDDFNVYLYDLASSKETTVTGGPSAPGAFPSISGNRVVYNDNSNVKLYDIITRQTIVVGAGSNARIDGDWVVWQTNDVTPQIRAYNASTGEYVDVTTAPAGHQQAYPDISGTIVAWTGWDGAEVHVYWRDLADSNGVRTVTPTGTTSHNVTVSGTRIYFKSNTGGQTQLHVQDLGGQAATPFAISDVMTGSDQGEDARPFGDTLVYRQDNGILLGKVHAPTVSIAGSSAHPAYDTPIKLTGSVQDFGFPIGNIKGTDDQLKAQFSSDSSFWVTLLAGSSTDSAGRYSITMFAPRETTYYRVSYYGAWNAFTWASHLSATSAVVVVKPHVALGKPKLPSRIVHGKKFTAWNYVSPSQTHGTKPIRVEYWRRSSGRYRLKKTVLAPVTLYSTAKSKYAAKTSLPRSGRWRVRAIYPSSATNYYTATGWVYRTVR